MVVELLTVEVIMMNFIIDDNTQNEKKRRIMTFNGTFYFK